MRNGTKSNNVGVCDEYNIMTTTVLGREPAWRLALQFVGLAGGQVTRKLGHAIKLRAAAHVSDGDVRLPDSELCERAVEHVAALSAPYLLHHGIRSFLFGSSLGRRDGLQFDTELLFLGCIMHDLGLTPAHQGADDFELRGARAAKAFLLANQVSENRAEIVHEAVALHARIGEATRAGPEAALTHLGAGMDVIGVRFEDFTPSAVEQVVGAWPRLGFKRCFAERITAEAIARPHSNIAGHVGLGFAGRIRSAPFQE